MVGNIRAPEVPFPVGVVGDWGEFFLAAHTLNAVVAKPRLGGNFWKRRGQAVDMDGDITHLANYDFVFFICHFANIALLAIGTLPFGGIITYY